MSITWPVGVPSQPLSTSIQEAGIGGALRTPMETGPAKQRRRYTAEARALRFAIPMTRAQSVLFEAWFDATLGAGVLPFEFTHPRSQATVTLRFIAGPDAYQIQWEPGGQTVQVACSCEVMP